MAFALEILKTNPSGILKTVFISEMTTKTSESTAFRIRDKLLESGEITEEDGKIIPKKEEKRVETNESEDKIDIF